MNNDKEWFDELPEIIERCVELATTQGDNGRFVSNEVEVFIDTESNLGSIRMKVYSDEGAGGDTVGSGGLVLSMNLKPQGWWVQKLEKLALPQNPIPPQSPSTLSRREA